MWESEWFILLSKAWDVFLVNIQITFMSVKAEFKLNNAAKTWQNQSI